MPSRLRRQRIISSEQRSRDSAVLETTTARQNHAPASRPWGVSILAVVNGIAATFFVFMAAYEVRYPFRLSEALREAMPENFLFMAISAVLYPNFRGADTLLYYLYTGSILQGCLASVAMLVAALGFLLWKPWARWLTVASAFCRIAAWVFGLPLVIDRAVMYWLAENDLDFRASDWIILGVITVLVAFSGTIYQILVIAYLTRPRIIAAFQKNEAPPPGGSEGPYLRLDSSQSSGHAPQTGYFPGTPPKP